MGSETILTRSRAGRRRWATVAAVSVVLAAMPIAPGRTQSPSPTITTLSGDIPSGVPGTSVSVKPSGLALAQNGDLYIGDPGIGVIWRLAPDGTIHHFAGTGRQCMPTPALCNGKPGPARDAYLNMPSGLAIGPDGDVYVSEMRANIVRRIDVETGTISTFAGNGETDFDEVHDGGPATQASLWLPGSLAFDSKGNLFIADINHGRIRMVTPSGIITTVAGCGRNQSSDLSCFFTASDGSPIETTIIGLNAGINGNGWGMAVGPNDDLYIGDVATVLRVDRQNEVYRLVAGKSFDYADFPGEGENGPASDARFSSLVAMAFGPGADLYMLDGGGLNVSPVNRVQKLVGPVGPASIVRHVGGCCTGNTSSGDGELATKASFAFGQPTGTWTGQGLAVAPGGDVYISDVKANRVRKIDGQTGRVSTIAGNGYGGGMFYMDSVNDLHPFGNLSVGLTSRGAFSGDGEPASRAQLYAPADVEVDRDGNIYVLDRYAHRVRRISAVTGVITTVAGKGCVGEDCFASLRDGALGDGGPATEAGFWNPMGIALDRTGTQLYIADGYRRRVRQVNLGASPYTAYALSAEPVTIKPGHIETVFGPGPEPRVGIIIQTYSGCNIAKPYCGEGLHARQAALQFPTDVATDSAGNLYVADGSVNQVFRAEAGTGLVTSTVGAPHASKCSGAPDTGLPGRATQLCGPSGLRIAGGALYVTESNRSGLTEIFRLGLGSVVRKVDLTDPLHHSTVIAGTGTAGFGGDGGPGTAAQLAFPHGVAVAPDGSVYIADTGNSRIRKVAPDGTISTVAGAGVWDNYDYTGCDFGGDGGAPSGATLCAPLGLAFTPDGTLLVADSLNNRIRAIRGL